MFGYEQINASGNTLMRVAELLIPDSGTFEQLLTSGQCLDSFCKLGMAGLALV